MNGSDRETRTHAGAPAGLAVGTTLADRYRIDGFLGIGGMGMVYRAHDRKLDLPVALKVLRPELAVEGELVERLRREVVVARQVSHRNVVRIHDIGQDAELAFLTMDLVPGRSLRKLLADEGRLAPERAERLVRQIAEGLAAAHAEGIVHRDLTPSNVLIDDNDRAWITDFGLARSLGGSGTTRAGAIVGTLDYLSPEQARGEAADARSDLYALGVVLFEMLTGELPFPGGTLGETIAQRLHGRPREIGTLGVAVPPALARVVRRCLERDPQRRYGSAGELLADLDGRSSPVPRRRLVFGAVALAALALAVAGIWLRSSARGAKPVAAPTAATPEGTPPVTRYAVAVVPLRDESGRPELAWLAPALTEQLSELLAEQPDLRVVANRRLVGATADLHLGAGGWSAAELSQVGALFGANRLVSGAVRSAGAKVLVELRLADGEGRELDPARRVSASAGPDELATLAAGLASALEGRFEIARPAALAAPAISAVAPAAFSSYAEGASRATAGDALGAVERLERAVALEPRFALAWLRLAGALADLGEADRARDAVERAAASAPASERRLLLEIAALRERLDGHPELAAKRLEELAGLFPNDADLAVEAGGAAGDAGDFAAAERWLERALELDPQQPRGWFLRAKFAIQSGGARKAVDDYLVRALVIQNKLRNTQGRADVLNAFGVAYKELGDFDRADEQYGQAAELRRQLGDRRGLATTLRNQAAVAAIRGDFAGADRHLAAALELLEQLGDRAGIAGLVNERGVLEEERGRAARALADYRRALDLRRQLGDVDGQAESLNNVGYASYLVGRYDDARAYWQQALELDRKSGNAEAELLARQSIAQLALAQGEWRSAAKELLATLDSGREMGFEPAIAVSLGDLGRLAEYEGRFSAAFASYREANQVLTKMNDARGLAEYALGEAETWLELGRPERALERVDAAAKLLEGGNREQRSEMLALRAIALARRGELDGARAALAAGATEARESESPAARARLDLASGATALAAGDPAAARPALERALGVASGLDHAWLELAAREALARAALAAGDTAGAVGGLRRALRRADRCGLYAGRWRLHALLAQAFTAAGEPDGAERERGSARAEIERLRGELDEAMRREFDLQEPVRELL